ncbi:MAG: EpsI family protein [Candidatus Omnitrophica bacterium]|nr:EpsI family protein [Candidatus Omnitrophota bacterium]
MRRNYLIVIALLLVSCIFVLRIENVKAKVSSEVELKKLPLQIASWQGEDLQLPEDVYKSLETRDILMRRYEDASSIPIYLSIVYSGANRHSFHPPELCFLGEGVELLERGREQISLQDGDFIEANILEMKTSSMKTKAWYWFAAGNRFTPNFYLQQAYLMLDALKGHGLKGALIRISTQGDSESVEKKVRSFVEKIKPYLDDLFKTL